MPARQRRSPAGSGVDRESRPYFATAPGSSRLFDPSSVIDRPSFFTRDLDRACLRDERIDAVLHGLVALGVALGDHLVVGLATRIRPLLDGAELFGRVTSRAASTLAASAGALALA